MAPHLSPADHQCASHRLVALAIVLLGFTALPGCEPLNSSGGGVKATLVDERLQGSQGRIAAALEQLARVQSLQAPKAPSPVDPTKVPYGLRLAITWTWQGPIEAAVRGVADRIGYNVRIQGVPPAAPPMVRVDAQDTPAVSVIESIGNQMTGRGVVRLDVDAKMIDLYFSPPTMAQGPRS